MSRNVRVKLDNFSKALLGQVEVKLPGNDQIYLESECNVKDGCLVTYGHPLSEGSWSVSVQDGTSVYATIVPGSAVVRQGMTRKVNDQIRRLRFRRTLNRALGIKAPGLSCELREPTQFRTAPSSMTAYACLWWSQRQQQAARNRGKG